MMKQKRFNRIFGVLLGQLFIANALAENTTILETIEVTEKALDNSQPGKVTIKKVNPNSTLRDILSDTPGVNFVINDEGGISNLNIRGLGGKPDTYGQNSGRVQMTLDGIVLPESFAFSHQAKPHGVGYFDASTISTVTVDRGPSVGSEVSAVGGVVALRTREPQDVLLPNRKVGAQIITGYDGRYDSKFATFAGAINLSQISVLLQYTKRQNHEAQFDSIRTVVDQEGQWENFLNDLISFGMSPDTMSPEELDEWYEDLYGGEPRYDTYKEEDIADKFRINTYSFLNKWNWDINENHRLSFTIDRFESIRKTETKNEIDTLLNQQVITDDGRNMKRLTLMLKGTHHWQTPLSDEISWTLARMKTGQLHFNRRYEAPLNHPNYAETISLNNYDTKVKNFQMNVSKGFSIGQLNNYLNYGINYRNSEVSYLLTDKQDLSQNMQRKVSEKVYSYFPQSKRIEHSIFIKNRLQYADLPVSLTPTLKYTKLTERSYKDTNYEFYKAASGPGSSAYYSEQSKKFRAWDYGLNLGWQINQGNYVSLTYSQANRMPGYAELNPSSYFHWDSIPNPNLKPERSRGLSLGWSFKTTWYKHNIELAYTKVVDKFETRGTNCSGGRCPDRMLMNLDEPVNIRSVEYMGELNFGAMSSYLKGWSLGGAISYAKGKDKSINKPLNSIAPLNGHTSLKYQGNNMNAFARVNFSKAKKAKDIGQYDNAFGGTPPPLAGWATLDLGLGFSFRNQANISFVVYNVFDKQYQRWENVNYTNADDKFRDQFWEPGRALSISLDMKF